MKVREGRSVGCGVWGWGGFTSVLGSPSTEPSMKPAQEALPNPTPSSATVVTHIQPLALPAWSIIPVQSPSPAGSLLRLPQSAQLSLPSSAASFLQVCS